MKPGQTPVRHGLLPYGFPVKNDMEIAEKHKQFNEAELIIPDDMNSVPNRELESFVLANGQQLPSNVVLHLE